MAWFCGVVTTFYMQTTGIYLSSGVHGKDMPLNSYLEIKSFILRHFRIEYYFLSGRVMYCVCGRVLS